MALLPPPSDPDNCVHYARAARKFYIQALPDLKGAKPVPPGMTYLAGKRSIIDSRKPRVGSVAIMYNSLDPGIGHMAVVYKITGNMVYITESNFDKPPRVRYDRSMPYNSPQIYGYLY